MNVTELEKIHELCNLIQDKNSPLGNISFRVDDGFLITKTGAVLSDIATSDFVMPKKENNPSCETLLHDLIYAHRPEIRWIIHLHDKTVMKNAKKLNFPITEEEKPFGTQELADEVGRIVHQGDYLIMKNHGIIALGKSLQKTINLVMKIHNACKND